MSDRIPLSSRRLGSSVAFKELETYIAQAGMVVRTTPERPTTFTICLRDRKIIDARVAAGHKAGLVEFPILIGVGTMPMIGIVGPFVCEADRDSVPSELPLRSFEALCQYTY